MVTGGDMLSGTVKQVIYHNETNGYAVFRVQDDSDENLVVVVGTLPYIGTGEHIEATGIWGRHPSYGEQFKAESIERTMPSGKPAILAYLSSGHIGGVGPVTAKRIVDKFGDDTLDVIEKEPEKLAKIQGITLKKAVAISEGFQKLMGLRRLMDFLTRFSVNANVGIQLYKWYGDQAYQFLRDNPYILSDDAFGVEFRVSDTMAAELGFEQSSPQRIQAGLLYELQFNSRNGHVFVTDSKLVAATAALLSQDEERCTEQLNILIEKGAVKAEKIAKVTACYLPRLYEEEQGVSEKIRWLASIPAGKVKNPAKVVREVSQEMSLEFTELQKKAIETAITSYVMLLTGGPGTGKSTSVRGMLAAFEKIGESVALCSPTGRAAKRLSELTGCEAATIHRLLEVDFDSGPGFNFVHNSENPLEADVVIVDETSMVDISLFSALVDALKPKTRLILVGDPDQLPSVGPGNVLKDLLGCGAVKTVSLNEIFRQARDSNIVMCAHTINGGGMPELSHKDGDFFFTRRRSPQKAADAVIEMCRDRIPDIKGIPAGQIQVLSPTKRGIAGTDSLNTALQEALNPPAEDKPERKHGARTFRTGDRVMHIRNNYDLEWFSSSGPDRGFGVFNGDIGVITEIDNRAETVLVNYDDRMVFYTPETLIELELAYAMTVHKSQGSEYPAVVLVVSDAPPRLLSRAVLYTAVTRAQKLLIVIGDDEVFARMAGNNVQYRRYSGLKYRLEAANGDA